MDLDDGAQLGRHLQPGATKYFSVRSATTEAEERYRWYTNGGLPFGLYWAEFVEVSDCCVVLLFFLSACYLLVLLSFFVSNLVICLLRDSDRQVDRWRSYRTVL